MLRPLRDGVASQGWRRMRSTTTTPRPRRLGLAMSDLVFMPEIIYLYGWQMWESQPFSSHPEIPWLCPAMSYYSCMCLISKLRLNCLIDCAHRPSLVVPLRNIPSILLPIVRVRVHVHACMRAPHHTETLILTHPTSALPSCPYLAYPPAHPHSVDECLRTDRVRAVP